MDDTLLLFYKLCWNMKQKRQGHAVTPDRKELGNETMKPLRPKPNHLTNRNLPLAGC